MTINNSRRVIVIGSGPAGAATAWKLIKNGIPVTMLDSGFHYPSGLLLRMGGVNLFRRTGTEGYVDDEDEYIPEDGGDPEICWWTNHNPGGLSNQWTGAVPRFAPEDFYEGGALHEKYVWPVTYDDVAPYYPAIEKLMHVSGTDQPAHQLPAGYVSSKRTLDQDWAPLIKSAEQTGQSLIPLPLADGPDWYMVKRGTAFNSFSVMVEPLMSSPLFEFIDGAHALELEWSDLKNKVTGLVYHNRRTGLQERLEADAFVVACGQLASTKLLFASKSAAFPNGLGNNHDVLGRYLHDHVKEWFSFEIDQPLSVLAPSAYVTRRPYGQDHPLLAASWTLGMPSQSAKFARLIGRKSNRFAVQLFTTSIPRHDRGQQPHPTLKDKLGQPLVRLTFSFDDAEVQNVHDSRQHLIDLFERAGIQVKLDDIFFQIFPGLSIHYGGTIRMHRDPQYGVLDQWNRVYEAPNVLVTDASAFTTGPEKNPTLTMMALAMRAADKLTEDLKTG
ncbi:MAG: GMC family oxidoreductase [Chloroflexota bacterium]